MSENKHTPENLFLLDGGRFKLSFNDIHCDECGTESDRVTVDPLGMYANELQGRWVALVHAENDRHLELIKIIKQRDELLEALENAVSVAKTARDHWDKDEDSKVGKYLIALSGYLPGYDKRTDEIHAAIASVKGGAA